VAADGLYRDPETEQLHACQNGRWAKLMPEFIMDPAVAEDLDATAERIWPPEEPDATEQLMTAMENFRKLADTLAGFKRQLVDQGFTDEQAAEIVTHAITTQNGA
jgi:hypothetical protein